MRKRQTKVQPASLANLRPGGGRPKGKPNRITAEIRDAARVIVEDPVGRAKMLAQYRQGKLHPRLVEMFHAYAYGPPKQIVRVEGDLPPTFTLNLGVLTMPGQSPHALPVEAPTSGNGNGSRG